jgi:hypothetical protein
MMYIFIHPDMYNGTLIVVASSESHARSILEDSQWNTEDYRADSFILVSCHNVTSCGVKLWSYE